MFNICNILTFKIYGNARCHSVVNLLLQMKLHYRCVAVVCNENEHECCVRVYFVWKYMFIKDTLKTGKTNHFMNCKISFPKLRIQSNQFGKFLVSCKEEIFSFYSIFIAVLLRCTFEYFTGIKSIPDLMIVFLRVG